MQTTLSRALGLRMILMMSSCALPGLAMAQTAPPPAAEKTRAVDEVVVTARKRVESVQDVPLTATVLSGQSLARADVTSVAQLNNLVPGLLVQPVLNNSLSVTMRGLGSNPGGQSFDQSVAAFFDGVFSAHAREFVSGIFDLERVEAVKGTQTALLGKNTSLGALSFISRKPSQTFSYDITASRELELDSTRVEGGVSIPLSDTSAIRFAGLLSDQGGWVHNTVTGDDAPHNKIAAGRISWAWRPTSALDLNLTYEHQKFRSRGQAFEVAVDRTGAAAARAAATGVPGFETAFNQQTNASSPLAGEPSDRQDTDRASLTLNYDLGAVTLTSLTGYTWYNSTRSNDVDFLPTDFSNRFEYESDRKLSQEFRVTSRAAQRFNYVAGVYLLKDVWRLNQRFDNSTAWIVPGAYIGTYQQAVDAYSAFGQAEYRVTDQLRLTGGLRYTREDKDATLSRTTIRAGALVAGSGRPFAETKLSRGEGNLDGSVGLEYRLPGYGMVYASWSQGSKSGGFQTSPTSVNGAPVSAEYNGERARTSEVGGKFDLPAGGHVNVAVFNTEVAGFQNLFNTGSVLVVQNLNVRSRGAEADVALRIAEGLTFNGATTYAEVLDLGAGVPLSRAPKWSGAAGFNLRHSLGGALTLLANAQAEFRSSTLLAPPGGVIPVSSAYTKLNLRVAVADEDRGWEVAVVGKNLTDERIASFGFPLPNIAQTAIVGSEMPRTIALQISLRH